MQGKLDKFLSLDPEKMAKKPSRLPNAKKYKPSIPMASADNQGPGVGGTLAFAAVGASVSASS